MPEDALGSCCQCGDSFAYDAAFFVRRALAPPKRCVSCRAARKGARLPVSGVALSGGPRFSLLEPDGQGSRCMAEPGLVVGARYRWESEPDGGQTSHLRQAFDVRLEAPFADR